MSESTINHLATFLVACRWDQKDEASFERNIVPLLAEATGKDVDELQTGILSRLHNDQHILSRTTAPAYVDADDEVRDFYAYYPNEATEGWLRNQGGIPTQLRDVVDEFPEIKPPGAIGQHQYPPKDTAAIEKDWSWDYNHSRPKARTELRQAFRKRHETTNAELPYEYKSNKHIAAHLAMYVAERDRSPLIPSEWKDVFKEAARRSDEATAEADRMALRYSLDALHEDGFLLKVKVKNNERGRNPVGYYPTMPLAVLFAGSSIVPSVSVLTESIRRRDAKYDQERTVTHPWRHARTAEDIPFDRDGLELYETETMTDETDDTTDSTDTEDIEPQDWWGNRGSRRHKVAQVLAANRGTAFTRDEMADKAGMMPSEAGSTLSLLKGDTYDTPVEKMDTEPARYGIPADSAETTTEDASEADGMDTGGDGAVTWEDLDDSDSESATTTEDEYFYCEYCDHKYVTETQRDQHQDDCDERPECEYCGEKFDSRNAMWGHQRSCKPEPDPRDVDTDTEPAVTTADGGSTEVTHGGAIDKRHREAAFEDDIDVSSVLPTQVRTMADLLAEHYDETQDEVLRKALRDIFADLDALEVFDPDLDGVDRASFAKAASEAIEDEEMYDRLMERLYGE